MNTDGLSLEEFEDNLKRHDWFYYMSDDHSVWQRGERDASRLMTLARLATSDYRKLFNKYHAKHFHREPFVQPFTFPFPEDGV